MPAVVQRVLDSAPCRRPLRSLWLLLTAFPAVAAVFGSREIVDGSRPSQPAISRALSFCACQTAMSSRWAKDRYRPDTTRERRGFTPPAWRTHQNSTTQTRRLDARVLGVDPSRDS